jgi:hypothetical protein
MRPITFEIDDDSLKKLRWMTSAWEKTTLGETISESLRIIYELMQFSEEGFVELTLRNPDDGRSERFPGMMPHIKASGGMIKPEAA